MGKHLKRIFKKMCRMVGVKYKDIDFSKDGWHLKHEWSHGDEKKFKHWFAKYMLWHKGARYELYGCLWRGTKKYWLKSADWFVFQYGWKYKQEVERKIMDYEHYYK